MSTSLTTTPYSTDPGETRNYCRPARLNIHPPIHVLYDLRYMALATRDSQNSFQMEPTLSRCVACDPWLDRESTRRTGFYLRETVMRYAMQEDADSNASTRNMARESSGAGAGNGLKESDSTCTGTTPHIRIFTLGRFSLAIDEQPVRSRGKARHRPLGLLQAMIALGGRDIAASRLCECLWPDSEGDLAGRNLNITVHRLRQTLKSRDAVLQHDGKLTLDGKICQVDVWDFERSANRGLEIIGSTGPDKDSEAHLRAALGLYSGQFLARESEEPWMFAPRLRLRTKFERVVSALSMHLETRKRFADTIDVCLQALELDPLNERLYRRLMSCYLKRGELASVLSTYRRCREALVKGLCASVSSETEQLYLEALHATHPLIVQPESRTSGLPVNRETLQTRSVA